MSHDELCGETDCLYLPSCTIQYSRQTSTLSIQQTDITHCKYIIRQTSTLYNRQTQRECQPPLSPWLLTCHLTTATGDYLFVYSRQPCPCQGANDAIVTRLKANCESKGRVPGESIFAVVMLSNRNPTCAREVWGPAQSPVTAGSQAESLAVILAMTCLFSFDVCVMGWWLCVTTARQGQTRLCDMHPRPTEVG